ncbi:MAG: hypothetical protein SGI89_14605 [bacterium]|nr:hypothetical protein [bacterium]
MDLSQQVSDLFLLALPVACISWTITHEDILKEPREFCVERSKSSKYIFQRKLYYLFTCEYCFSHYVTLFFLIITGYHLLFEDWRGYLIGGFSIVWIANIYMSIFGLVRVGLKKEKMGADIEEVRLKKVKEDEQNL